MAADGWGGSTPDQYRSDGVGPFIGLTKFPLVRLRQDCPMWAFDALKIRQFVVLGEVEKTHRYILLDVLQGTIIPGMWPSNMFERVPKDAIDYGV